MDFDQNMKTILNIESANTEVVQVSNTNVVIPKANNVPATPDAVQEDLTTTRENLDNFLDMGRLAYEKALELFEQTQHPRWGEVIALLLKQLNETNSGYLDAHKKISEINKNNSLSGSGDINVKDSNVIFTGSAKDLLAALKPRDNGKEVLPRQP